MSEVEEGKQVLRDVMSVIHSLSCCADDFLGEELYIRVNSFIDGIKYTKFCDDCGDLIAEKCFYCEAVDDGQ